MNIFLSLLALLVNLLLVRPFLRKLVQPMTRRCSQIGSIDEKPSPSHFYSQKSFQDMKNVSSSIQSVIDHLQLQRPSKIQAMTYNDVLSGKTCVIAEQTGSGKTLAYLLPTIQRMIEKKPQKDTSSPGILIIAPTTELAR